MNVLAAVDNGTNNFPAIPVFDFAKSPLVSLLQLALIFVLPVLVGLITDMHTSDKLKVVLHGGTSFATAFLTQWLDSAVTHHPFEWVNALANGLLVWLLGIAVHTGIWKPLGVAVKAQASTAVQLVGPRHRA